MNSRGELPSRTVEIKCLPSYFKMRVNVPCFSDERFGIRYSMVHPTEFLETELRTGRSPDDKSAIHVI